MPFRLSKKSLFIRTSTRILSATIFCPKACSNQAPKGERIYVQASYIIADDNTYEREFGNLRAIKDNYPKYVISMTPLVTRSDDNGITHLHLRRFLTEEEGS